MCPFWVQEPILIFGSSSHESVAAAVMMVAHACVGHDALVSSALWQNSDDHLVSGENDMVVVIDRGDGSFRPGTNKCPAESKPNIKAYWSIGQAEKSLGGSVLEVFMRTRSTVPTPLEKTYHSPHWHGIPFGPGNCRQLVYLDS